MLSMRLALLSDIHGNEIALEAVLADVAACGGVDACWVLGDVAALGHAPVAVIERLAPLSNARFVRGNTDRYVVTGARPGPTLAEARADPRHLEILVEIERSFSWTLGAVSATGWLAWLAGLPLEQRLTLPDGTRLLAVHAAPGRDDGPGIHPGLDDAQLSEVLAGSDADLIVAGHTHVPLDRSLDGVRVLNLGSIGLPVTADVRASYGLLEAGATGYRFELRRVAYDRQAVIASIEESRHPTPSYLMQFMRGEKTVSLGVGRECPPCPKLHQREPGMTSRSISTSARSAAS